MFVTQSLACTVQNSTTPITAAQLAASAARADAQDSQFNSLLQKWITMLDRKPESFKALGIAPSEFVQPQSAADILNLDANRNPASTVGDFRAGRVCNPDRGGPKVIALNGAVASLPVNEPVNLLAAGPLGAPSRASGMGDYRDLQPHVIAQRVAARRRRARRGMAGCACGGTCGGCGDHDHGMGDFTGEGSGVLWGSLAAAGFLIWATLGNKQKRR